MNIIESDKYKKAYSKILKNNINDQRNLNDIKLLIKESFNLHELIINPLSIIYHIEQKKGNLKEYYSARINNKIRLIMKPIGKYPYKTIEITDIEFVDIDNKHYERW